MMQNIGLGCINDPTIPTFRTWNGASVIDLIFASTTLINTLELQVHSSNVTKHNPVVTRIPSSVQKWQTKRVPLRKLDLSLLPEAFSEIDFCNPEINVSEYANLICKTLHDCRKPQKSRKSKPWFNGELYELHQKLKKLRQNGTLEQTHLKTIYKRAILQAKKQFFKKEEELIIHTAETDKKKFWDLLKIRKGTATSNPIDIYEWHNHFENLLNSNKPPLFVPYFPPHQVDPLLTSPFSIYELYQEIHKQPNKKATGNDGIAYETLKQSFQYTGYPLLSLVNTCWSTGTIPKE